MRKLVPILVMAVCAFVPVFASRGILVGYAQTASTLQGDEFNASNFTAPFLEKCGSQAIGTCPDAQSATTWSLNGVNPGFLRIMTQPGSLVGSNADLSNNARNLVLQGVNPAADYTVTTKLTFPGGGVGSFTPLGQTGGLLVYQDDDHFIYLGRAFTSANGGLPQIEFRQEDGTTELVDAVKEVAPVNGTVYLRLVKTGTLYQASYSYDNVTFTPLAPGIAPTPTAAPTNTLAPTNTPVATTAVTPTATSTTVPVATATSTALPVGYTASYQAPQVGLFAWGGTNASAVNNQIPADFDWFRVGANSQTPVPTATTTNTPVVTATATSTIPPLPTLTSTATATSTAIPTATATAIPTNTPTPRKPKAKFGFSYASVWYHYINIGHVQHIQVQAKIHARQGIWVTVHFATGTTIRYFANTDKHGFWQATFRVPGGTISRKSNQAIVTFQLWKGNRTIKSFSSFRVLP